MIYFLHGPDDFSIKERIGEFSKDREVRIVSDKETLESIAFQGMQEGLFGNNTVTIITEILPTLQTEWLENQKSDVIITATPTVDKRTTLFKWLNKHTVSEEYLPKDKSQIYAWVKKNGYRINPYVLNELWERHGSNLWIWYQELEKLQAFAGYDTEITKDHIAVLSNKTVEEHVFSFLDEFSNKNSHAIVRYSELLSSGVDEYYLFSMLARQIRLLILSTEDNGLKGQHPFVIQKLQQQVKKWNTQEIRNAHTDLVLIDQQSKTGVTDIEDELPAFVLKYV